MMWRRILAATDFSATARVAQRSAETLARDTGADLVLTHVVETPSSSFAFVDGVGFLGLREEWVEEARRQLQSAADRSRARGVSVIATEIRMGKPWAEILESARLHEANLVCLGNSGRSSFERLLLGSTAENVVRHSPVPVLVTRSRPLRGLRRVLAPVSFDDGSRAALAFAIEWLPRQVEIEAFHALPPVEAIQPWFPVPPPSVAEATADLETLLHEVGADRVRARVTVSGEPGGAILKRGRTWKADLIVLCTQGRGGLAHVLLGSVAERVARYADRPVLVLPPPGRAWRAGHLDGRIEKRRATTSPSARVGRTLTL
jgi:nucleotide-binding universal stress UspA family protein